MPTKPVVLAVDDDPEVLRAVARDLRHEYGDRFRVLRADSGARAMQALQQLKSQLEPVALLLVDQRMPDMSGVDFLERARGLYPEAKRALLTAYADTEAAIKAINDVRIDYYLMKPWDPPDERLYPVLDDLLEDWLAGYRPPFEGVKVIGHRWSPESHRARDFLARNQVPYKWYDLERDQDARTLLEGAGMLGARLPVLILEDGRVMEAPGTEAIAQACGLVRPTDVPFYDLLIVGAGPAGLAAAVYGASEGLRTVIVERDAAGGQAGMSSRIENYLGFPNGLSGSDLARRALTQARRFGADFLLTQEVCGLKSHEGAVVVNFANGSEVAAHSVIISTGVAYRRLEAEGVAELSERGVYYGSPMTESESIRGEAVYVIGGANSAGQAALHFADRASNVTMVVRGATLSAGMSQYLIDRIEQTPNIQVLYGTQVAAAHGTDRLEALTLRYADGSTERVEAHAMFVFIGAIPPTQWLQGTLELDDRGFIMTGADLVTGGQRPRGWLPDRDPYLLETSVPGVFAAGDVRHGSGKRVAAAVGEGAMAVMSVWQHRAASGL